MTTDAWNYVNAFERDRTPLGVREEGAAKDLEIELLRAALVARQRATPYARLTPAEIRLRAFEQTRAARGMAQGFEYLGEKWSADKWYGIANDFERAAQILAPA